MKDKKQIIQQQHMSITIQFGVTAFTFVRLLLRKTTTENIKINIMCFNIILSESSEIIVLLVF